MFIYFIFFSSFFYSAPDVPTYLRINALTRVEVEKPISRNSVDQIKRIEEYEVRWTYGCLFFISTKSVGINDFSFNTIRFTLLLLSGFGSYSTYDHQNKR